MKKRNYGEAIVKLLYRTKEVPLDVEKIRRGCGIGNWQTALKHCLELQYEGKILGARTSKGWVFWTDFTEHLEHAVRLPPPYKHQPRQTDVGMISLSNSPITDGVIRARKSPTRGE